MKHLKPKLTKAQKTNLRTLATHLMTIDPRAFDMSEYYRFGHGLWQLASVLKNEGFVKYECGTVACAVGHGPGAGISPIAEDCTWQRYAARVFGADRLDDDIVHVWCFDGAWSAMDNSPTGAAQRIIYMLEHGVPEDFAKAVYVYRDTPVPLPELELEEAA